MTHTLFRAAFIVILTGCLAGCLKNDNLNPGPVIEIPVPPIHLKIVDAVTGQALFMGENPTYTLKDIRLYMRTEQNLDTTQYQPFGMDSIRNCLVTYPSYPFLLLKIADLPYDTLTIISSKKLEQGAQFIDSISLNGKKYAADSQQIITIKK